MTPAEFKSAREALGLTQKELAERLDLKTNSIALMERGERPIMLVTALAVAHLSCRRRNQAKL